MLRINKLLITGVLAFISVAVMAQNNTNSPYTRYGYGDLGDRSFGAGRAMGGVGIGLRSPLQINPLNPASYSSMRQNCYNGRTSCEICRDWTFKDCSL